MSQAMAAAALAILGTVQINSLGYGMPELKVLVYDATGDTGRTPVRALGEAARLLHAAGISVRWVPCLGKWKEMPELPHCRIDGSNTIILRIVPAPRPGLVPDTSLGFTIPAREGAVYATVFRDRVHRAAVATRCSERVILGHSIAHEIGHVLLGTHEHATEGIMSAVWSIPELKQAEKGLLRFRPDECARMRAEADRRTAPAISKESRDEDRGYFLGARFTGKRDTSAHTGPEAGLRGAVNVGSDIK